MTTPPKPTSRRVEGDPVYREVEEHGRSRIVLMRKVALIRHTPAWDEIVSRPGQDPMSDLVFERVHHPAVTTGQSWWEKA